MRRYFSHNSGDGIRHYLTCTSGTVVRGTGLLNFVRKVDFKLDNFELVVLFQRGVLGFIYYHVKRWKEVASAYPNGKCLVFNVCMFYLYVCLYLSI